MSSKNSARIMMEKRQQRKPSLYASRTDFCRIFEEKMTNLYLLSFLLTADHSKAKQCFLEGLDDAAGSPRVFREWANSWARRSIIQRAIRLFELGVRNESRAGTAFSSDVHDGRLPTEQMQITAVLELPAFERFVFVMSVLERYSNLECSLLLGCGRREVRAAQTQAFHHIGSAIQSYGGDRQDERVAVQT